MDNNHYSNDGNAIEIHYWFNDDSHAMDAFVQNKCEYELLALIKAIGTAFGAEVMIETEPLGEGGLKRWFKFILVKDKKTISIALLTALVTGIVISPISTGLNTTAQKIIENYFEDKPQKLLNKEKTITEIEGNKSEVILKNVEIEKGKAEIVKIKAEIENIEIDTKLKSRELDKNSAIIKKRSNFYELLEKYPKVEKISLEIQDENKKTISESSPVNRNQFKEFILASDELEPIEINDATIEIISPVLKKGDYKWRGIYMGEVVSFSMNSGEFKASVQSGKIEFKNGSSIKCLLKINRKVGGDGIEQITGYSIMRVDEYFDNNKPIETAEGKKHRQKKEAEKQQLNLGFN